MRIIINYKRETYWRKYQPFFPQDFRLTDETAVNEEWWSWQGNNVHLDRYAVPGSDRLVILLHGGGGYSRMLSPMAVALQRFGWETLVPDLPGYGLTQAKRSAATYQGWVDCICDIIRRENPDGKKTVVLFGLSLGGYLAYLSAAASRSVHGVIATTLADPREPIVRREFTGNKFPFPELLLATAARLFGGIKIPIAAVSAMDGIANDPELVRVVREDRLGGGNWTYLSFLQSIFDARPAIEPEDFTLCPVLLAHPAADRWTSVEASRLFFDKIAAPKELVLLEGCGHFPVEEPGITQLQETCMGFLNRLRP